MLLRKAACHPRLRNAIGRAVGPDENIQSKIAGGLRVLVDLNLCGNDAFDLDLLFQVARLGKVKGQLHAKPHFGSYSQIWCTASSSCGGSAVLDDLGAVVELHALDHLPELAEAA